MATRMWHKLTKVAFSTGFVWLVLVLVGALGLAVSVRAAGIRDTQGGVPVAVQDAQGTAPVGTSDESPEAASGDARMQAGPPIVDGLFYGSGENPEAGGPYMLLAENPGESKLFYYRDGNLLYATLVVSPAFNDNVFGIVGRGSQDYAYLQSAGWSGVGQAHEASALIGSDHAVWNLFCGGGQWAWQQDYIWDPNGNNSPAEADWLSDPYGPDGTPPPGAFITSASSLQWNLNFAANNPGVGWDVTLGGARTSPDTWKSYAGQGAADADVTDDGYPWYFSAVTTTIWEWQMVYECVIDVSVCGGNPFTLWPVTGHNSPAKGGNPEDASSYDWGDLPDTGAGTGVGNYQTLSTDNGARHKLVVGLHMGSVVDPDTDGQPTTSATGDDTNPDGLADDEDGVYVSDLVFTAGLQGTVRVTVTNQTATTAYVYGFIDFNGDGDFGDANEVAYTTVPAGTVKGVVTLNFGTVPQVPDILYARFRLSTSQAAASSPTGLAPDGEVEDYQYGSPTAVSVFDFRTRAAVGHVVVEWETSPGVGILGFNLFRWDPATRQFVQVNEDLIVALPDTLQGGTHRYVDQWAQPGKTHTYQLAALDLTGAETLYGPFEVRSSLWSPLTKGGRGVPE